MTSEQQAHLARVKEQADMFAVTLRDAADAGVPQAVIIPQLMLAFQAAFGKLPAGLTIPGLPA